LRWVLYLFDPARFDALSADQNSLVDAINIGTYPLQIGQASGFGSVVGVRDIVYNHWTF